MIDIVLFNKLVQPFFTVYHVVCFYINEKIKKVLVRPWQWNYRYAYISESIQTSMWQYDRHTLQHYIHRKKYPDSLPYLLLWFRCFQRLDLSQSIILYSIVNTYILSNFVIGATPSYWYFMEAFSFKINAGFIRRTYAPVIFF